MALEVVLGVIFAVLVTVVVMASVLVGLSLERGEDPVLDPGRPSAVEAAGDRLPGAVALGEAGSRAARAQDPKDAVEGGAVVVGGTTDAGLLRRTQWAQPAPLRLRQVAPISCPEA